MKGFSKWNYTPYKPFHRRAELKNPYICRLSPLDDGFEIEWLDSENKGGYVICVKEREGEFSEKIVPDKNPFIVRGIEHRTDFEVRVEDEKGLKSDVRLVNTKKAPGVTVNYLHQDDDAYSFSGKYLCSPSIVRINEKKLIVSMDIYGGGDVQSHTILFESLDNGESWSYLTEINPCFWGKLFVHNDELYMLGCTTEYGDVVIGKSADEGKNWTAPVHLFAGSSLVGIGFHRAPCVVINENGRIYTSLEFGSWNKGGFYNCVISADENSDLLNPKSWSVTEAYKYNEEEGVIEGNTVTQSDGEVLNILRWKNNKALVLKCDTKNPEKPCEFVKELDFPFAHSKFEIQRHKNGKYYAVGNELPLRNVLSVYSSENLNEWKKEADVVNMIYADRHKTGFQYPSFVFDTDGIIVASRTAYNNAHNFHDSNFITIHKVKIKF